ncbi:uncharacterized protein G2W53_038702 [Senna tora]|uniref:Glycine-rich protein n=1 Tax=Senna tora TaxID=362788 RepID=A0A834W5G5_9FABA|nr:uncharacterized protein G2W53_038702 [Senna tora]
MRKTSVLWFIILMYSAYATSESHSQKQPKVMYGMMMESSKGGNYERRRNNGGGLLHVVEHKTSIKRAKAVYGGANDNRHPRSRNSANSSFSINHALSFFMAMAALLLLCFF